MLSINTEFSQDYEPQENIVLKYISSPITFAVSATSLYLKKQRLSQGWDWRFSKSMKSRFRNRYDGNYRVRIVITN